MLKHLTIIFSTFLLASAACVKPQSEVNAANNNSVASGSSEAANPNDSNRHADAKSPVSSANAKTFLGDLDNKRIEINLTRDGNNLSGTYKYEKIGKDLKLSGTIDAAGNFTLQETDGASNKTGVWKGVWKESDGRVTLTGKWKSPKGGSELDFSADEQVTNFTGGAKFTTKSSHEENKAKFYEITAEYPELSGVDAATAANFNQIVKKIVDDSIGDFKKNIADHTTPEDLKRYKENGISLYDQVTYDVELANDNIISLVCTDANYMGGAHGGATTTTLNFDLKNNRQLKLADIFEPNTNYLKTLSDLSRADLEAKLQKDDMLDDEMLNDGVNPKEENFRSWNLTKKGLQINFDAYQVAAYAAGPQEVVIPYAKLQSILRKDGVAMILAK